MLFRLPIVEDEMHMCRWTADASCRVFAPFLPVSDLGVVGWSVQRSQYGNRIQQHMDVSSVDGLCVANARSCQISSLRHVLTQQQLQQNVVK